MSWIHEPTHWPRFTWDMDALAASLAQVSRQQGELLGKLSQLGFELQNEASLEMLTNEVVHSAAIEGERYNRPEVRSSLASHLGLDIGGYLPVSRDVEGIVSMMLDATQNYQAPLTAKRLFGWHAALFPTGYSGIHPLTVGSWRKGPMAVVSGPMGRGRVHYEAPAADRLPQEMEAFFAWCEQPAELNPLLKAAIAHFWFVTLHPFDDGNGRIARAIADLMLARSDGRPERFYSMSTQIERERGTYYQQLEFQQRNGLDITDWLDWFLSCLGRSLEMAEKTQEKVLFKTRVWQQANQGQVNVRQRQVLNRLLHDFKGHLTSAKYAKLAKCSTDTALRDIQALEKQGVLVKNIPGGRSTSYRLASF